MAWVSLNCVFLLYLENLNVKDRSHWQKRLIALLWLVGYKPYPCSMLADGRLSMESPSLMFRWLVLGVGGSMLFVWNPGARSRCLIRRKIIRKISKNVLLHLISLYYVSINLYQSIDLLIYWLLFSSYLASSPKLLSMEVMRPSLSSLKNIIISKCTCYEKSYYNTVNNK